MNPIQKDNLTDLAGTIQQPSGNNPPAPQSTPTPHPPATPAPQQPSQGNGNLQATGNNGETINLGLNNNPSPVPPGIITKTQ